MSKPKSNRVAASTSASVRDKRPAPAASAAHVPIALQLGGVALVALLVRAVYLYQLHGTLPFSTLILDGRVFDLWAQRIAAGDWLGTEVFYQAPLYPYFLAAIYAVAGRDLFLVRMLQAALSVGSCVFLASAGRRFFGARIGIIAGLLLALYPPAFFFDGLVQKAALDLWFMTLLLALLGELLVQRTWYWFLASGVALGLFTLSRENALLLYPIVAAWLWFGAREISPRRRVQQLALFTAGLMLVLLPVVGRNHHVGGELVVTTSLGPNFYIGNHAGAQGRYEPLVPNRADPRFERIDAKRLAEEALGRSLSMSEVSSYWLSRGLQYVREQPGAWLRLLAWKLFLVFNTAELEDGEGIAVYAEFSSLLRVLYVVLSFGVVLPLAVLGLWLTRTHWRRLALLYAILLALAGSTALFFVFARYRFTFVPVLILFAAAAIDALLRAIASRDHGQWLRVWGPGCGLALAAAIVCHRPLPILREEAITYVNLGMGLLADGRPAQAIEPLRRAIAIKPSLAGGYQNLGGALTALGRHEEAAEQYELALQRAPDFGMAHASLGQYYFGTKRFEQALPHLTRAVELVPEMPVLRAQLAELLASRGDAAGALSQLRQCWRGDVDSWFCANNLATLLATHRDPQIRNGREAVAVAEQLAELVLAPGQTLLAASEQATVLDTVAAAYAEVGRYEEAVNVSRRALAVAGGTGNGELIEVLQARLQLYESRQPYRSE